MSGKPIIGFIGLGQMGGPMAANIAKGGYKMLCFDKAGTEALMPEGATACGSVAEVVMGADTIFLSLPNGAIMESVAAEIADVDSAPVHGDGGNARIACCAGPKSGLDWCHC